MKIVAIALALALTPAAAQASPSANWESRVQTAAPAAVQNAIDIEESPRFKIRNVRIDGQSDVVKVKKGGSYRVSLDVLHDCSICGNAVNQVIVGLAGQDRAQVSVWNGKQRSGGGAKTVNGAVAEDNPGAAQWVTVEFDLVVPAELGAYPIRARYAQAYKGRLLTAEGRAIPQQEYPETLGWWKVDRPTGPDAKSTIGYIIVVP
ncbi:hypothetical protein [Actinoplanes derwentensis]|uniref:Uncharacterized protein n=1 Tax=Actinoplanes derwentensis TaxID=113562 RepID=A0A1H1TFR5_9ACTN|nr:hypothetical protein [Actinoplanes derwentensis]GID85019.1 hypothetical protein Ade03nite_39430 [Actinoplanes derwentensis]SDS59097.1 hypothetical protein SAMN04489716_1128 [Actinoplanes derwentensis]